MQFWTSIAVCLTVQLAGAAAKSVSLPKSIPVCNRNDDSCLTTAVQKALPIMAKGLPNLGALPIDPLRVTEMLIDQGSGPVSLKLTLKNQDLMGISSAIITSVKSQMDNSKYVLGITGIIPTFTLRGDYVIDGRVLVLPIQGQGRDNLTLTDLQVKLVLNGHVVKKEGEEFIDIDDVLFTLDTSRLHLDFQNLFDGNRALGDSMLTFLNENWSAIFQELKPGIQDAISAIFKEISKRIYSTVPYAVMHPTA